MKTAELTGVLLDYWTARADGRTAKILKAGDKINSMRVKEEMCVVLTPGYADWWQPFHVYWGSCGEIIEREGIAVVKFYEPKDGPIPIGGEWAALSQDDSTRADGPTPLVAAMRAFIASRFGDTVPDETGTR